MNVEFDVRLNVGFIGFVTFDVWFAVGFDIGFDVGFDIRFDGGLDL